MTPTCIPMALADKSTASVLIVADGRRDELRTLLAGASHPILWLMEGRDALSTVSQHLALYRQLGQPIRWLHWVCHGSPGILEVGAVQITADELWANQSALKLWDIDELSFWSCRYAADAKVIRQWENYTGASVFGTTLPLGRLENKLINWRLSSRDAGEQSSIPFNPVALKTWRHQLSTGAVDSAGIPANSFLSVEFEKFIVKKLASKKQKHWDYKLIVSGEEKNSIWFQDRPLRNYGHFEFDSITGKKAWDNLFQSDNPNALLSGGGQSFLFENGPFRARKNSGFVARIRALETEKDVITGDWDKSSLLIDSTSDVGVAVGVGVGVPLFLFAIGCAVVYFRRLAAAQAENRLLIAAGQNILENRNYVDVQNALGDFSNEITFQSTFQVYQNDVRVTGPINWEPSRSFFNSIIDDVEQDLLNATQIEDPALQQVVQSVVRESVSSLSAQIDGNFDRVTEIYADQYQIDINDLTDDATEFWNAFVAQAEGYSLNYQIEQITEYARSPGFQDLEQTIMQGGGDIDEESANIINNIFEGVGDSSNIYSASTIAEDTGTSVLNVLARAITDIV